MMKSEDYNLLICLQPTDCRQINVDVYSRNSREIACLLQAPCVYGQDRSAIMEINIMLANNQTIKGYKMNYKASAFNMTALLYK